MRQIGRIYWPTLSSSAGALRVPPEDELGLPREFRLGRRRLAFGLREVLDRGISTATLRTRMIPNSLAG